MDLMTYLAPTSHRLLKGFATLFALLILPLALAGCATSAKGPEVPSVTRAIPSSDDTPETWSGYRLYLEAMLARNAEDFSTAAVYLEAASKKDPASLVIKRELAVVYLLSKKRDKALSVLTTILETTPNDTDSLLLLVRIRLSERKAREAEALLETIIDTDPMREEAYYRLGLLQSSTGRRDRALNTYLKLLKAYPYAYAGYYYAASIYKERGDLHEAIPLLEKSLTIAPEFTEARLELADIYTHQQKFEDARAEYKRILTQTPDNLPAQFGMALLHHRAKETDETKKILHDITPLKKPWAEIYELISRLYIDRKKYSEAHTLLTGIMGPYEAESEFNYILGFVCEKLDDSTEAIHCFKKIRPDSDYYERAILFVGAQLWEQGHQKKAVLTLENALEKRPESLDILSYLASFHEEMGLFEKAEGFLRQGVALNGMDPSLYFRLGVLYDKWGKNKASVRAMKKVLKLDPDNPNALNYLGYSYAREGIHLDEAERLIKRAMKHRPDDGYITDSLGWVYYQKGQFTKAVVTLREAVRLLPEDPMVLEHLADALAQDKQPRKAVDAYKKSLRLGHEEAPALEEKIRRLQK